MQSRYTIWLIPIAILFALAAWLAWPSNNSINLDLGFTTFVRDISARLGLDLQGGLQILLEADLPADKTVESGAMEATIRIIESRINALGVSEPLIQQSGDRRVVVELPGLKNPEQAIALIRQTGLLEFVDAGSNFLPEGSTVKTDYVTGSNSLTGPAATPTSAATATAGATATSAATATTGATPSTSATPSASPTPAPTPDAPAYHTVMTGAALKTATVQSSQGRIVVAFTLTDEGKKVFGDHTSANVGRVLAIVLDKKVISSPRIESAITGGEGVIQGSFTTDEANSLALQLRYGSLPVPLKIAESRTIGPTLGQDSVRKSQIAGIIGLAVTALFMILYYRLPGVLAVIALLLYVTITFALFKLIPVTLTLPGIAGFVLSVGVAVDANILIFERMKEELRSGKKLITAVDEGFRRAWPSIRDSNISTLITCVILFWFGSQFGASIVKGFALTLALGVFVSLFTAITVTRTLLHSMLDNVDFSERHSWFGI
ncbi:MAG: protein translocase subunit SecD [Chloroflexota bacterium]